MPAPLFSKIFFVPSFVFCILHFFNSEVWAGWLVHKTFTSRWCVQEQAITDFVLKFADLSLFLPSLTLFLLIQPLHSLFCFLFPAFLYFWVFGFSYACFLRRPLRRQIAMFLVLLILLLILRFSLCFFCRFLLVDDACLSNRRICLLLCFTYFEHLHMYCLSLCLHHLCRSSRSCWSFFFSMLCMSWSVFWCVTWCLCIMLASAG